MSAGGGYENAPATRLLATHCCACGRPLVDSASVQAGMGPDCREKYGYNIDCTPEARKEANRLVYEIALDRDWPSIPAALSALRDLGFTKLADRLTERLAAVTITVEGNLLVVASRFNEAALTAWRAIPGRRWDGERKVNTVPVTSRAALWAFLKQWFRGEMLAGPRGLAVIQ